MIFSKSIFLMGSKKRNPSLMPMYEKLKESEYWTREQLEDLQLKKLQHLLKLAYEKTEYYRRVLDDAGVKPNDIQNLKDLKRIPILEKRDILENLESMRNHECKNVFYSETSGSTGEPMIFYRNEEWDSAGRAAQMRGYSWYGVNPWDKNGYLWGHIYGSKFELKTRVLDSLINRFRLFSYDKDAVKGFVKKLKNATYLEGYSSMIYEVAKIVNEEHLGPIPLKLIKGTSEKIYDSYQPEVIKAFGSKMVSEYGSGESTLIAFECPQGNMHVVMENVIVEEENGEVIVTNLNSFSMPIIRYKLGDSISLNREKKCSCGMNHEIVDDVLGRVGQTIYGRESKYPSLTLYYIFKSFAMKHHGAINYQGIQDEKGKLKFLLDREITKEEENGILTECRNYFGEDMDVELVPCGLVRDYSKKFKDYVSKVNA